MLLKFTSSQPKKYIIKSKASQKKKAFWLIALGVFLLWFGYRQVSSHLIAPEAILVLGGAEEREKFAAELASSHPQLPIWVSSGSPKGYVERIFARRGIKGDRLHLDYQASDTLTNFTTLVDKFKAEEIDSIYLVTSDNHMPRALVIGKIVFGSRGIAIKPISVPSNYPPEPLEKCLRDGVRALLWLFTTYAVRSKTEERFISLPSVMNIEH